MSGLNRAMLIGHLGADPELKFTQGGQAVLRIRLATTEKFKDQSGEMQERTEWHSVTVWGKRGEALASILAKGKQVYIEGRIQTRSYDDKNGGAKRYSTEINATEIILLGGRNGGGGGDEGPREQRTSTRGGAQHTRRSASDDMPPDDFDDDSIPF